MRDEFAYDSFVMRFVSIRESSRVYLDFDSWFRRQDESLKLNR